MSRFGTACIRFVAAIGIEKVVTAPIYYGLFPFVVHRYHNHLGLALVLIFIFQIVFFLPALLVYDWINRDLVGLVALKQNFAAFKVRLREWYHRRIGGWLPRPRLRLPDWLRLVISIAVAVLIRLSEFIFCAWQFSPLMVALCLRPQGRRGRFWLEFLEIVGCAIFAAGYWTAVWIGVFHVPDMWRYLTLATRS